jgi:hypothetical protein
VELLLTVENHFRMKDVGIIILPALDYPKSGMRPFSEQVLVRHPDGCEISLKASFDISIPVGGAGNKNIVIMFPGVSIELIPIGSKVLVTP